MSKSFKRQLLDMRQKAKGNHPMRFLFTVTPISASDIPRDVEYVIFVWQRGAKIQETKVQPVARSTGAALFDEGSALRQTTTCYCSDNMWQPKPYKLKLQSVTQMKNGEDKTKTIGRYDIDFSVFCAMGLTGGEEEIEINFKPKGVLRATIAAQWLKDFDMDAADDIMSEMPYGQSFTQSVASFGTRTDLDWEVLDIAQPNNRVQQIDTSNFNQLTPDSSLKDEQWQKAKEALYEEDEKQNEVLQKEPTLTRKAVSLPAPPKTTQPVLNLTPAPTPSSNSNPFDKPPSRTNPFDATPSKGSNPFDVASSKNQISSFNSAPINGANPFDATPSKNTNPFDITSSKGTESSSKNFVVAPQNGQIYSTQDSNTIAPQKKAATKTVGPSPRVGQRVFSTPEPILEHPKEQDLKPEPQSYPTATTKKQVPEMLPPPKEKKLEKAPSSPSLIASPSPTLQTPSKETNEKLSKFGWFKKQKSNKNLEEISSQDNLETLRQKAMLILGQLEKESEIGQKTRFYIESLRNSLADVAQNDSGVLERMSELQQQLEEAKQVDVLHLLASTKAQLAEAHFQILYLKGEVWKERARNRAILNKFTAQQTERDILLTKQSRRLPFRVLRSFRSDPTPQ